MNAAIPVLDMQEFVGGTADQKANFVQRLALACRDVGFFYVKGYSKELDDLSQELDTLGRDFFAHPNGTKNTLNMARSGLHWKGFFELGSELTNNLPDHKEGIYFGEDLPLNHPSVERREAMHGPNQWPEDAAFSEPLRSRFKPAVLRFMQELTQLGQTIMEGVALSLGLPADWFRQRFTKQPFTPFRIFHYPSDGAPRGERWGVGQHTDYGVLTILKQDKSGGLEVKTRIKDEWIAAPPIENTCAFLPPL